VVGLAGEEIWQRRRSHPRHTQRTGKRLFGPTESSIFSICQKLIKLFILILFSLGEAACDSVSNNKFYLFPKYYRYIFLYPWLLPG
jgi:hypothetical protein